MSSLLIYRVKIILALTTCIIPALLTGQELNFSGQESAWVIARYNEGWAGQAGIRFIPEFSFQVPLGSRLVMEGELSINAYGSWSSLAEPEKTYGKIKPYRGWVKIGNDQFELRGGLQKINFGSATMLRSLMWFDRIDARDPLQLTDGVYGLLGRYYFLNNANIWLWTLYGNKGTRGLDYLDSDYTRPEFGARIQLPVPRSEIAFTYHNREVNDSIPFLSSNEVFSFNEQKFAFDAKGDIGIGLWVEAVVKYSNTDLFSPYEKLLTVGADYTFGVGNGINVSMEYLGMNRSDRLLSDTRSSASFIGITGNYPISLVSALSTILYINPDNGDLYRFVNLSLTYDRFSFYFIGYWNPAGNQLPYYDTETTIFMGKGVQVMAVFNY